MTEQRQPPTPGSDSAASAPPPDNLLPHSPELGKATQQEFLWHTHDNLAEYARFADTKAAFAGTLAGALVGCLYGAGLFSALVQTSICKWTFTSWMSFLSGLLLSASILLAGFVVYPRLKSSEKKGFIFWGGIAAFGSAAEFKAAFRANTDKDLDEELQKQIFDVAKHVLVPKYRNVSLCLWALVIGAALAATALMLKELHTPGATPVTLRSTPLTNCSLPPSST